MATTTREEALEEELLELPELDKKSELLLKLVEQITLFEGKKRRGKTCATVAVSYNLRNTFGIPLITVGSKMGLKEAYGPHQFIDEREFLGELDRITAVTKQTPNGELQEAIEEVLERMGVNIYRKCIAFDEAYKLFDSRTPNDKLVRTFGYFIAQSSHYHSTILLTAPHRSMIDKRVRWQVDWFGRCAFIKRKQTILVRFKRGISETFKLTVPGPKYWPLYDSWELLGYRKRALDIEGL